MPKTEPSKPALLSGVFVLSVALITLELLYTRLFSFALWHYMAYLVISISMLGLGVSGVILSIYQKALEWNRGKTLAWMSLGFSLSILMGIGAICRMELDILKLNLAVTHVKILLFNGMLALPFFFCGSVFSLIFSAYPQRIGGLYAVNMVGSGIGCLVVIPAMWYLGLPGSLIVCALLGGISASLFLPSMGRWAILAVTVVLTFLLFPFRESIYPIRPAPTKLLALIEKHLQEKPEYTRWTPLSRIDVVDASKYSPGRKAVLQDGDAVSFLHEWNGDSSTLDYLNDNIAAGPYRILKEPNVLLIGIGGGPDILIAHHFGAKKITAVEINPASIEVLTELYKSYNGGIANFLPSYQVVHAEGRSYVRRSDQKYDLIHVPGADSFTALQSGAYMVAESYLYTADAMKDYFSHLTEDGILGFVRISFDPPREHLKLVTSAATAMRELGIEEPWNKALVIRDRRYIYLTLTLFKLKPFTPEEIESYRQWLVNNPSYTIMYAPGYPTGNPYEQFFQAFAEGGEEKFYDEYFYNVRPATDDSPFFFRHEKLKNVLKKLPLPSMEPLPGESNAFPGFTSLFEADQFREKGLGIWMLIATIVQMTILTALFILAPLTVFKKRHLKVPNSIPMLFYFSCLGLAYVSIEISFIQRLILFLGHPTYSTSVVIFTFLVFSGLGSATTGYFGHTRRNALWIFAVLFLVGLITHAAVTPITNLFLPIPIETRIVLAVILLAPLSFLMGMPFPMGIGIANENSSREMIAWAWGVNSAFSVMGSMMCIAIAMALGFSQVLLGMLIVYLMAACVLFLIRKPGMDLAP